jgi:DNA-binding transcriptional MerR regulator
MLMSASPMSHQSATIQMAEQDSDEHVESGQLEIGIAEMARRFQTTLRTLRFYEQRGLLKPRRVGMNRYYDPLAQQRFHLIDEARKLGFTLTEIAGMLPDAASNDQLRFTSDKLLDQIEYLEAELVRINAALGKLRLQYYLVTSDGDEASDQVA